uniref:Apextrin C-terminal domain-containing protein n=1 Tax=Magallana gigas TaxID=29159 RepID=A0A8W8LM16_MAGGI
MATETKTIQKLPRIDPFYMMRYTSSICQRVSGMSVTEEIIETDDEDTANNNSVSGSHPKVTGTSNHRLYYCYYILKNINRYLNDIGDVPRENRNTGYKPQHALKYEDIHNAITFIVNYAAAVGMPQSEAPRGRDGVPSIFLPSSDTKKGIHELYLASCDETNIRARKMSSFEEAWLKFVPYIK